jgi:hypothetical protein
LLVFGAVARLISLQASCRRAGRQRSDFVVWLGTTVAIFFSSTAEAKVGAVRLQELVDVSQVIATVHVETVEDVNGVHVAEAAVLDVLKGSPSRRIRFLASPTWMCDTSTAVTGETALVFLVADTGEHSVRTSTKNEVLFRIAHSGRGRMPIRDAAGKRYVDFWASDILMPVDVPSTAAPPPIAIPVEATEIASQVWRSVELAVIKKAIGSSIWRHQPFP